MTEPTAGDSALLISIHSDVAVIKDRLSILPDHEERIRALQVAVPPKLADRLGELERQAQQSAGGRDTVSRIWAAASVLVAAGSGVAAWLALAHR